MTINCAVIRYRCQLAMQNHYTYGGSSGASSLSEIRTSLSGELFFSTSGELSQALAVFTHTGSGDFSTCAAPTGDMAYSSES